MTRKGECRDWYNAHLNYQGDDCLIWPFRRLPDGYCQIRIPNSRKMIGVHRSMCIDRNGHPPSDKHEASHSCGNGRNGCVNPNHVRWKLKVDNIAERSEHGNTVKGMHVHSNKLSESQVLAIRDESGSHVSIAAKYGICKTHVGSIKSGKKWAWL